MDIDSDLLTFLRDWFPPHFAADVFKALIGSFVGAGLAFWFAIRKDNIARLNERKAVGNLAVITLMRQLNDFLYTRAVIVGFRDELLRVQPHTPLWMHLKPMSLSYAENLRFNLDSLVSYWIGRKAEKLLRSS